MIGQERQTNTAQKTLKEPGARIEKCAATLGALFDACSGFFECFFHGFAYSGSSISTDSVFHDVPEFRMCVAKCQENVNSDVLRTPRTSTPNEHRANGFFALRAFLMDRPSVPVLLSFELFQVYVAHPSTGL
jgi:hypothetical protein